MLSVQYEFKWRKLAIKGSVSLSQRRLVNGNGKSFFPISGLKVAL
jgi:hypothetical protein